MPPDAPAATRGPGRRRRVGALAALVLLAVAFLGLGVVQARDDSPT
jgi:ferric-dicitrate binding protein FerR (iron transport regulator)